jgi:UDP-N-acetylmuramoyl-tripeptide--D-alanyl-D-alanine ligase
MKAMTVGQVASVVGAARIGADAIDAGAPGNQELVTSAEFDTRRLRPGALFVALVGEHVDGHDFATQAAAAGAVAILGSREVTADIPVLVVPDVLAALAALAAESARQLIAGGLTVIGITGSAGKTSTKDLVAAIAGSVGETVAPPESFNNELGHPYTVLRATESTRFLVLELSARGIGHIAMLARIAPPRIGVVLNVGSAHLGEFGSVEGIARAKGELVEALPPGAAPMTGPDPARSRSGGVAILNADDGRVLGMRQRTRARVVTVGTGDDADVRAADITEDDRARPSFLLQTVEGDARVTLAVAGRHQVGNALAAAAVGLELGLTPGQIADVLGQAGPASKWRMEITDRADGVTVINDAYNANPDSMKAALRALATIGRGGGGPARRTWAVLGRMAELGNLEREAHDEIGRLVVRLNIDRLIAVGPAVRPLHLGAHLEGSWNGESEHVADIEAAIDILNRELRPNDVVLVKASRSVGLERVAQALLAAASAADPPAAARAAVPPAGGSAAVGPLR